MRLGLQFGTIIFFIVSILIGSLYGQMQFKPQEITLEINNRERATGQIVAAVGSSATILCQNTGQFDYCRFVVPDLQDPSRSKTVVLSEKFESSDPNFEYFGNGLLTGQCGIKIKNVQDKYNGNFTCTAAVGPNEFSGLINLFIAKPPLEPVIEQEGPQSRNGLEVGHRVTWKCIVRDGRPPAQIQWYLKDGEQYLPINSMNPRHRFETQEDYASQLFASILELERTIQVEDDGKFLVCRSIHESTRTITEAKVQLSVRYSPTGQRETEIYGLQLDKSNSFSIQIKSNPRPRIEWKVDGDVIEERGTRGRFIVPEIQQIGQNLYNATLTIAPLTVEDLTKTYYLSAFNEIGRAEFNVRISSADTPAGGLEIGAIVGIVVVLAILLIIILLIVFARITGKWCFATKSVKNSASESTDEFEFNESRRNKKFKDVEGGNPNSSLLRQSNDPNNMDPNQSSYSEDENIQKQQQGSSICCNLFNKKNNNDNIQYSLTTNHEFFDTENAVYNPTTVPITKNDKNKSSSGRSPTRHRTTQNRTPSYAEAVGMAPSDPNDLRLSLAFPNDNEKLVSNENNSKNIMKNRNMIKELNNRMKNISETNETIKEYPPDVIPSATVSAVVPNQYNSAEQNLNNSSNVAPSRDSKTELLMRGNELGIPGESSTTSTDSAVQSRMSKWIPKGQRELLEKQARILSKSRTPPPVPEKPTSKMNDERSDDINIANNLKTTQSITNPITSVKASEASKPNESKLFETEI